MLAIADRFWTKVERRGPSECWPWTATIDPSGYGRIKIGGRRGRMMGAHRVAYELAVGPILDGLHIDHLCRVRHCVNPAHLEPVTPAENKRRGITHQEQRTHCPAGHAYDEANTYVDRLGKRSCRACHRTRQERYNAMRGARC